MQDDLRSEFDEVDQFDGATPRLFQRVFIAGEDGSEARGDALALVGVLAGRAEAVTVPGDADLIVIASARDAAPGRVTLDPADQAILDRAGCPVAVAPRGLAVSDDDELRRIDVAIDGSRGAAKAQAIALRLALANSARLRLVAVAELIFEVGGKAGQADPRELERLRRRLEHAAEGLAGARVETELREGLPDQIIVGLARQADLLVLGSRAGYGNAGRVVLGDVAMRVLRGAPCPTLVVPAP